MTDFTETVKQNAVFTFSIVLLSSLALTFLILLYTGIFGFGDNEKVSDKNVEEKISNENISEVFNPTDIAPIYTPKYVRVQLPMLYGSEYSLVVPGKKRGCDTVYMVDAWARADGDDLANHLQVLFDGITPVDFYPGNYLRMYQRDLKFVGVSVENETARVSVSGALNEFKTECEKPRLQIQIEEIALKYPGIKKVEIVLNGRLVE